MKIFTCPYTEYTETGLVYRQCRAIHLSNANIENEIDYIKHNGVDIVFISPAHGFTSGSIEFLLDIKNFWGLDIFEANNIDISVVEKCKHIKYLRISDTPQNVDISSLTEIETLVTQWRKDIKLPCPETSKLKYWHLWHYPVPTLEQLPHYKNLIRLSLYWGSVQSLEGIERFTNMKLYEHSYGKKLYDISALIMLPYLEEIFLDHCKKVETNGFFEQCLALKCLKYVSCANLPSLSFLKKMKSIESFRFGDIDIKDGNVAHLLALNDFGFYPNKRHYSHTCEELKQIHISACPEDLRSIDIPPQ